jgi:aspartate racemase
MIAGIIGGLGSLSSAQFYKYLIDYSILFYKNPNPEIILKNIDARIFVSKMRNARDLENYLITEIKSIEQICDFVIIVCNTAHHIHKSLKSKINVPLLSFPELCVMSLKNKNVKSIGLLGTDITINSLIYQKLLSNNEIEYSTLTESYYTELTKEIETWVSTGQNEYKFQEIISKGILNLEECECDSILYACTDLSTIEASTIREKEIFSSTKLVAELISQKLNGF